MGILSWLLGKKDKSQDNFEKDVVDPQSVIADTNKEAMQMYQNFEKANEEGKSVEVMQQYIDKHQLTPKDLETAMDDKTLELLEDYEAEEIERDLAASEARTIKQNTRQIREMMEKKHDVAHQLAICKKAMAKEKMMPYPFERAVILLSKEKRFLEALELSEYVEFWRKKYGDGMFSRRSLEEIVKRIPKLKGKLK